MKTLIAAAVAALTLSTAAFADDPSVTSSATSAAAITAGVGISAGAAATQVINGATVTPVVNSAGKLTHVVKTITKAGVSSKNVKIKVTSATGGAIAAKLSAGTKILATGIKLAGPVGVAAGIGVEIYLFTKGDGVVYWAYEKLTNKDPKIINVWGYNYIKIDKSISKYKKNVLKTGVKDGMLRVRKHTTLGRFATKEMFGATYLIDINRFRTNDYYVRLPQ